MENGPGGSLLHKGDLGCQPWNVLSGRKSPGGFGSHLWLETATQAHIQRACPDDFGGLCEGSCNLELLDAGGLQAPGLPTMHIPIGHETNWA